MQCKGSDISEIVFDGMGKVNSTTLQCHASFYEDSENIATSMPLSRCLLSTCLLISIEPLIQQSRRDKWHYPLGA